MLAEPDLIVTGESYGAPAMAGEILRPPAMRALAGTRRVSLPDNLMTCGTPLLAEAAARLRAAAEEPARWQRGAAFSCRRSPSRRPGSSPRAC